MLVDIARKKPSIDSRRLLCIQLKLNQLFPLVQL